MLDTHLDAGLGRALGLHHRELSVLECLMLHVLGGDGDGPKGGAFSSAV